MDLLRLAYAKDMHGHQVKEYRHHLTSAESTILTSCISSLKALLSIREIRREIHAVLREIYLDLDPNFVIASNEAHTNEMVDEGFECTFVAEIVPANNASKESAPAGRPEPVFTRPGPSSRSSQEIYRQGEVYEDNCINYNGHDDDDDLYGD